MIVLFAQRTPFSRLEMIFQSFDTGATPMNMCQ